MLKSIDSSIDNLQTERIFSKLSNWCLNTCPQPQFLDDDDGVCRSCLEPKGIIPSTRFEGIIVHKEKVVDKHVVLWTLEHDTYSAQDLVTVHPDQARQQLFFPESSFLRSRLKLTKVVFPAPFCPINPVIFPSNLTEKSLKILLSP